MSQFSVYENINPATRAAIPFLLNVQSDLLEELSTRAVVPLYSSDAIPGQRLRTLTPLFDINDEQYVMMTPQLAGIQKNLLGPAVADLSASRDDIIAALDLLITGI